MTEKKKSPLGRLKHLSKEERREFASMGGKATAAANARAKDTITPDVKNSLNVAIAKHIDAHPNTMEKIVETLTIIASDPEHPKSMQAADILFKHSGMTAPKRVEATVEEPRKDISDTVTALENLGVSVKGVA